MIFAATLHCEILHSRKFISQNFAKFLIRENLSRKSRDFFSSRKFLRLKYCELMDDKLKDSLSNFIFPFNFTIIGPAERLFSEEYYKLVHSALKDDGILSVQGTFLNLIAIFVATTTVKFVKGLIITSVNTLSCYFSSSY